MENIYDLGLKLSIEKQKEYAVKYLNKKTLAIYKDLLFELIDCINDIQNNKKITIEHCRILRKGLEQPLELIFCDYSGKYVAMLSHHLEEAKELLKQLSTNNDSSIRFNAVTILLYKTPIDVSTYIINQCVNDKSIKVRKKVADICERLNYTSMVKILELQYEIEKNTSVKKVLASSISLLTKGYVIEKKENGTYNIWIKTKQGLTGKQFKEEFLQKYTIENIVNEVRESNCFPWELV